MTFLVVVLNTQAKTTKLTTPNLTPSKNFLKNWLLALPGSVLTTYPRKLRRKSLPALGVHPLATPMTHTTAYIAVSSRRSHVYTLLLLTPTFCSLLFSDQLVTWIQYAQCYQFAVDFCFR